MQQGWLHFDCVDTHIPIRKVIQILIDLSSDLFVHTYLQIDSIKLQMKSN